MPEKKQPEFAKRLYTVDEAAAWLGISRRSVYSLIDSGKLRTVELRGVRRRLIDIRELERLISQSRAAS